MQTLSNWERTELEALGFCFVIRRPSWKKTKKELKERLLSNQQEQQQQKQ